MTRGIGSSQEQQSSRENPMSFSRRTLLKASAASAVLGGIGAPLVARAQTAEFTYKYANNLPDGHPMNARAKEMAARRSRPRPMAGSTCRFFRTTSLVPIPTC
jgi:hypothetical protein